MTATCAILPVKDFDRAKTRLRPVLGQSQCATLARTMAIDMLKVLTSVRQLDRIIVLGQGPEQARLAQAFGCEYMVDDPGQNFSQNVTRVFRTRDIARVRKLLFIAADLPLVTVADVSRLFERDGSEITIFRALRDHGTNALLACPATPVSFSFGRESARRHAMTAAANQRTVEILDDSAFQRDIDVPEDLYWHCRQGDRRAWFECLGQIATTHEDVAMAPNTMAYPG